MCCGPRGVMAVPFLRELAAEPARPGPRCLPTAALLPGPPTGRELRLPGRSRGARASSGLRASAHEPPAGSPSPSAPERSRQLGGRPLPAGGSPRSPAHVTGPFTRSAPCPCPQPPPLPTPLCSPPERRPSNASPNPSSSLSTSDFTRS